MLNISEQISVDERCAMLAERAFEHAVHVATGRVVLGVVGKVSDYADRIIALREAQAQERAL